MHLSHQLSGTRSYLKTALVIAATVLLSVALLIVAPAADAAKRPLPKKVKVTHTYAKAKVTVKWKQKKGKKKIQIRQGSTVIASKTAKKGKTKVRFNDSLLTHGEEYQVRVRLLANKTETNSKWKKKTFTFNDLDFDNDGIHNDDDTDDDNDGILDVDDSMPNDHDNDGIDDFEDDDDDADTIPDDVDDYPNDHDNDGIDDFNDDDDDNDGILDADEEDGQQFDEDNDGIPDNDDPDYEEYVPPEVDADIVITSQGFDTPDVTVAVGGKVRWTNQTPGVDFQLSADDGSWISDPITFGQSYTQQFDSVGVFDYSDPFQSESFSGTITVQ